MAKTFEGKLIGQGMRFGIVVARFNEFITSRLLSGAIDALLRHGVDEGAVEVAWVPGAFEIPLAAKKMTGRGYDAVICLGAVIRGATPHFEYIASEVTKGIAQIGLDKGMPIVYGLITADTLEQAIERAGTKAGNKGADAALTALEMANLLRELQAGRPVDVEARGQGAPGGAMSSAPGVGVLLLNPGSPSLPKDDRKTATVAVADTGGGVRIIDLSTGQDLAGANLI